MWWACGGVFCWFVFVGWLVKVFGCLVVFWNLWIFASGFPDFRGLCNAALGLVCSNLCCCWSVYGVFWLCFWFCGCGWLGSASSLRFAFVVFWFCVVVLVRLVTC